MSRVRELVSQQLQRDGGSNADELSSTRSTSPHGCASGWDVVSEASSSPFVPIHRASACGAPPEALTTTIGTHAGALSDGGFSEDDFEQIFSMPFRRVTSGDFSASATPNRLPAAGSQLPTVLAVGSADRELRLGEEGKGEVVVVAEATPDILASRVAEDRRGMVTTVAPRTKKGGAVETTERNFFNLVSWSTTAMCRGLSSAIWALWDALRDSFFPVCRRRELRKQDPSQASSSSLLSCSSSFESDDDMEARTTAFMAASAILVNAAVAYAVTNRVSVRQAVAQASLVIRDVFSTGLV